MVLFSKYITLKNPQLLTYDSLL